MSDIPSLGKILTSGLENGQRPILSQDTARMLLEKIRASGFAGLKSEPSLLDLIGIPATDMVTARLDSARSRHTELSMSPIRNRAELIRSQGLINTYTEMLERAKLRDELQEWRPVDCWCLGYGGKDVRYLPMPTGGVLSDEHGGTAPEISEAEYLRVHCTCPEGESRAEYDAELHREYGAMRTRQAVIRRFGEANLPAEYLSYTWREHPDRDAVKKFETWINDPKTDRDSHHWVLFYGPGGRGKTTLMGGRAAELAADGESVLFRTMPDLLSDIRSTFNKTDDQERLRQLLKNVHHLFLDDIGAEVPRDWVGEFLYQILNGRHNDHKPTYLSTNLWEPPTKDMPGGDIGPFMNHIGERLWGRVKRMAEPILMNGQDLRDLPHVTAP